MHPWVALSRHVLPRVGFHPSPPPHAGGGAGGDRMCYEGCGLTARAPIQLRENSSSSTTSQLCVLGGHVVGAPVGMGSYSWDTAGFAARCADGCESARYRASIGTDHPPITSIILRWFCSTAAKPGSWRTLLCGDTGADGHTDTRCVSRSRNTSEGLLVCAGCHCEESSPSCGQWKIFMAFDFCPMISEQRSGRALLTNMSMGKQQPWGRGCGWQRGPPLPLQPQVLAWHPQGPPCGHKHGDKYFGSPWWRARSKKTITTITTRRRSRAVI